MRSIRALQGDGAEFSVCTIKLCDLADGEVHLAGIDELAHGIYRMRRSAELVTAVDQRDALRQGLQVQRPVQSRVAAADHHHMLVAKGFHLAHGVMDGHSLVHLDAGDWGLLRLKRPATRSDHDGLAGDRLADIRLQPEQRRGLVAQHLNGIDHLAVMEGGVERRTLLEKLVD